jgi:hypothetical protein
LVPEGNLLHPFRGSRFPCISAITSSGLISFNTLVQPLESIAAQVLIHIDGIDDPPEFGGHGDLLVQKEGNMFLPHVQGIAVHSLSTGCRPGWSQLPAADLLVILLKKPSRLKMLLHDLLHIFRLDLGI